MIKLHIFLLLAVIEAFIIPQLGMNELVRCSEKREIKFEYLRMNPI